MADEQSEALRRFHSGRQSVLDAHPEWTSEVLCDAFADVHAVLGGLGLMHVFPSPSHRLFAFLFRLHPDFEHFAVGEISARAEADHALLHWLPFSCHSPLVMCSCLSLSYCGYMAAWPRGCVAM